MGMYDNVNYECVCPNCHGKADGFQSKEGECILEDIEPSSVDVFYTLCGKCGCWIEFTREDEDTYCRRVTGKNSKLIHICTVII